MFIEPSKLNDYFKSLSIREKQEIVKRSFFHPNGFYKIVLTADRSGNSTRLHVWKKGTNVVSNQHMHNHGWDFTSHVLYGSLLDVQYKKLPYSGKDAMTIMTDICFKRGSCEFKSIGKCECVELSRTLRIKGDSYTLESDIIHKTFPQVDQTVTLVHQSPLTRSGEIFIPANETGVGNVQSVPHQPMTIEKLSELFDFVTSINQ